MVWAKSGHYIAFIDGDVELMLGKLVLLLPWSPGRVADQSV